MTTLLVGGVVAGTVGLSRRLESPWLSFLLPIAASAVYLMLKYPEIPFAMFLLAGVYKADPRLSFLPEYLDLTAVFGLLSLIGSAKSAVRGQTRFLMPPPSVWVAYGAIVGIGTLSLGYTLAPVYGTDKWLRFLSITSSALFIPFFLFQRQGSIRRFFMVLVLVAVLMVVDLVPRLRAGAVAFGAAFGSNYLAMGRTAGSALLVCLLYALPTAQTAAGRLSYAGLLPLLAFGLLASGGRGPVLALGAGLASVLGYLLSRLGKCAVRPAAGMPKEDVRVFALLAALVVITTMLVAYYGDYFGSLFTRLEVLTAGGGRSALERVARFRKAVDVLTIFPEALTGLGVGGFSVFYGGFDDKRGAYPHDIFLEFGAEFGILGLLAITLLILSSVRRVLSLADSSRSGERYLAITCLALLVFMVVNASISGDVNDNRLLFAWIGVVHACSRWQRMRASARVTASVRHFG